MSTRTPISRSTGSFSAQIEHLREALTRADCVLIGAGAGLSTSAGFTYTGERFERYFADFAEKYGFRDMYSGGFYPFDTQEEYWAYWSRYIHINRYMDAPRPVYERLFDLVRDRDYFVLTTNVDHCFQKAGFDKGRLFYTQGDYGLFQCSEPCCQETFDNESTIEAMWSRQKDMRVPSDLLPRCPHCGRMLTMNLRADERFVEDAGWRRAAQRYGAYLRDHASARMLLLELGVGYNTPDIIKYPFWRLTAQNPTAVYSCINAGEAACPEAIRDRAVCIRADIGDVIDRLN